MTPEELIAEFEAQPELKPGQEGWWKVWGANAHHIRPGDIVLIKDEADPVFVIETFRAKAYPARVGFVDATGQPSTVGALWPIVLVRRGTHNTLA